MNKEKLVLERKINEALHYVSNKLLESGHNPKPVLFHSFKIGYDLYNNGYSENIVIAGILHDLIEDTETTYENIKADFNEEIANLVQAVSFDPNIKDKKLQTKELFNRVNSYGFEALIIKCADLLDNINYVGFVTDSNKKQELIDKYHLFIEISKKELEQEKIYQELLCEVNNLN